MARSVLLLVNREKKSVARALPEIRARIEQHGRLVDELEADSAPSPAPLPKHADEADLVVVLGGDGTLLSQTRRTAHLGLPMLGINLGKLGFMAEFDLDAFCAQAPAILSGAELTCQDRPLLDVRLMRNDASEPVFEELALNDAVVTAGPPYRMISLSLTIGGEPGPAVEGDGLIVCTPIGSTAYNVSAGGPILDPELDAMAVTPIAAHSLSFRPFVVPGDTDLTITMGRVNDLPDGTGTSLVVDGQVFKRLEASDRIRVAHADRPARFVTNPDRSYFDTLINKLRWGVPLRGDGTEPT